jgi:hypothetical protein
MLARGLSRENILNALMRASGLNASGLGGAAASISLRVGGPGGGLGGGGLGADIFSVGGRGGIGGLMAGAGAGGDGRASPGLTRSWSGLDTSDAGRDGTRIMRHDLSLEQLRSRGDRGGGGLSRLGQGAGGSEAGGGGSGSGGGDESGGAAGGSRGGGGAGGSRGGGGGGSGGGSSRGGGAKAPPPPPRPAPDLCEVPPIVRVRYGLGSPDDSGASLAAVLRPAAIGRPVAGGVGAPPTAYPPHYSLASSAAAAASSGGLSPAIARAAAAAGAPPTPLQTASRGSTLFHTLRTLAAAAATRGPHEQQQERLGMQDQGQQREQEQEQERRRQQQEQERRRQGLITCLHSPTRLLRLISAV